MTSPMRMLRESTRAVGRPLDRVVLHAPRALPEQLHLGRRAGGERRRVAVAALVDAYRDRARQAVADHVLAACDVAQDGLGGVAQAFSARDRVALLRLNATLLHVVQDV